MGGKLPKKPKWNEVACPKCKLPIAVDASKCPHCQTEFSESEMKERFKSNRQATALGCVSLIVLALAIAWCSAPASVPDKPTETAKADAIEIFRKVIDVGDPCDRAASAMASALATGNSVDSYRAADDAESACLPVFTNLSAIDVPSSLGKEAHETMKKTLAACENAYVARWSAAGTIKKALDGDNRPSTVVELERSAADASNGSTMCGMGLAAVAMSLGATQADLGIKNDSDK